MRELKIKAWDNENKRMIYFNHKDGEEFRIEFNSEGIAEVVEVFEEITPKGHMRTSLNRITDVIILPFTGSLDKNGREIYEGDIDSDDKGNLSVVCYLKKYGAYCFVPLELYLYEDYEEVVNDFFGTDCFFHNYIPSKYSTIIGDIYQNKELMGSN